MVFVNTPFFSTLFLCFAICFVSCSNPEERLASKLDEASTLLNEEPPQVEEAIAILDQLNQEFSNNPDIVEALAFAHSRNNDQSTAAFFYEEAARLDPERSDLFLFAASVYENNREFESAIPLYEEYLLSNPSDLLSRKNLANIRLQMNQPESALKTWLEYVDRAGEEYTGRDAFQIGQLFQQLGNLPQAQSWYQRALEKDDTADKDALTSLLNLSLADKNWPQVKLIYDYTKQYYPAIAKTPKFKSALEAWESIQAVKKEVAKQAELPKTITQETPSETVVASNNETSTPSETPSTTPADSNESSTSTNTTDSIQETEAVAVTDTPKQKPYTNLDGSQTALSVAEIDPTTLPTTETDSAPSGELIEIIADDTNSTESPVIVDEPGVQTGKQALASRNYKDAINLFWKEIGAGNTSAENWYGLAQAYELTGQLQQAEVALLESTRQAPEDVRYALEYLRIAYKTRTLREAFSSIERVLQHFPDHPDVLLSVAKAYETIGNNRREASYYYNRFLQVAPDHEKFDEIKEKYGQ